MKKSKIIQSIDIICVFMLIVLIILALLQVLFRYVLQISLPWTEEVARMVYSFLIFTGVVSVEAENQQMKTTFLLEKMPPKVRYIVQGIINGASIIFCGGLTYGAVKMVNSSWDFKLGSLPWISSAVVYIPIIIFMPFVMYFLLKQMIHFKEYYLTGSDYDID